MIAEWLSRSAHWPVELSHDPWLRQSFDLLRTKWTEVPFTRFDRLDTRALLGRSDEELVRIWQKAHDSTSSGEAFAHRGWYELLYREIFRGRKVLDLGCGLAPSTIYFAENGAHVTFVDIVETNVEFVRRVCRARGITGQAFCYLEDLRTLGQLPRDYDFIFACGSLVTVPVEVARREAQALLEHLPPGGRWIEQAYPKSRWVREGKLPFHLWGARTDGGAPWTEWRDLAKLQYILAPARFDVVFNWFDLVRVG
jgi:2-polyprenyl-3-methyl-5-hydroxy-6-metoxy-1,4-benzoquinol methylase